MPISERELKDLVAAGVIDAGTAERIAAHFKGAGAEPPRFDLTHTAYYLGALVVMSALGWFMNEAWARYGGWVLTIIAVAYAVAFTVAGESLWRQPGLRQPGALLFTLAVWMTPLAVFGIQYALGWWPREARSSYQEYYPQISGSWVVMEAATIVAAAVPVPHLPASLRVVVSVARSRRPAHRVARPRRIRAEAADHAAVRRHRAWRHLPARPPYGPGLRLLAVPVRSGRVLGRANLRRCGERRVLLHQPRTHARGRAAAAEDLHGVRGDRRVLLPRSPGVRRVQELPALPGGADRAGHSDQRGGRLVPHPRSRGGGGPAAHPAGCRAAHAAALPGGLGERSAGLLVPGLEVTLGTVDREGRFPLRHRAYHHEPGRVFGPISDRALRLRRHHDADRFAVRPHQRRDRSLLRRRRLVEPGTHVHRHHQIRRDPPRHVDRHHGP